MRPALDAPPALDLPERGGRRQVAQAAGFVVLVAFGLVLNLGTRPLEFEEPRRALVALEMALRGNLIVPTTNGDLYLNKPPVFNWVLLAFMRLFGSTEAWVLRLPTVVSMLAMAAVLWDAARRWLRPGTALTAAAFLLTFTTLLFYGTLYGEIDVFYALVVFLQALAIFALEQRGRPAAMFAASYLLAAIGFLTKGLPSVAVQALTLAVWLVHQRRWRWLLSWAHLGGLAVFAACAGGYLAAYARYADPGPYLAKLLFDATERTAADGVLNLGRTALHLVQFPLDVLALTVPWCVFVPGLFARDARTRIRSTPFLRFCVAFVAANVVPYWISAGNRPRYMFMFLPFLATLLAVGMEHLADASRYARTVRWVSAAVLALAAVGAVAVPFTPYTPRPLWGWAAVTAALAALAVAAWRARSLRSTVGTLLLALAVARVGYDLVIPAHRRQASPDTFYEQVAATLDQEHREPLQLLGGTAERVRRVPIAGVAFTLREREWFSFSLSFHYTERRGELLRYADVLEPGKLYLAHASFEVGRPHEVVRVFRCPVGHEEDLKLVRVLE